MRAAAARRGERGVTAVLVAVCITVLVGMLGFAINVGHLLATRGENQNAVDASALAAAMQLDGRNTGLVAARATAENFALAHVTDGNAAEQVVAGTVEFGHWYMGTRQWELITARDAASIRRIQAVRVVAQAPQEVWFPFFLRSAAQRQVGASAIAVAGGPPSIPAGDIPFTVRQGCFENKCTRPLTDPEYVDGYYYVALVSTPVQTAGGTALLPANVNQNVVCELLQDPNYFEHRRDGDPLSIGDVIRIQNGESTAGGNCGSDRDGDPTDDGRVCEILMRRIGAKAMMPIVQYTGESDSSCSGAYNQSATVVGFSTVTIAYVSCPPPVSASALDPNIGQWDPGATAAGFQANCASNHPCIVLQLHCNVVDPDASPGGAFFGTSAPLSWLTR